MSLLKLVTNYAGYNVWATQQYADWLLPKPEELLHREVRSSFPSIIKTLQHIGIAQAYWHAVIAEHKEPGIEQQEAIPDTKGILPYCLNSATRLADLACSYSEVELLQNVDLKIPGFPCELPKYEYIMHVVNHGIYHRGQIVTIGRNLNLTDIPNTDYNVYNATKQPELH